MKKSGLFLLILAFISVFNACKKDDKSNQTDQQLTVDDAKLAIETGKLSDDLNNFSVLVEPSTANKSSNLPSCVTQSFVQYTDSIVFTLNFDPNGCTFPNGNTYKGTVIITKRMDVASQNHSGSIEFIDFSVNDIQVEGSSDFEYVSQNTNGFPQLTHTYDFTFTFPNGDIAARNGTTIKEWIEGSSTPIHHDDVFLISGNAHILKRNGVQIDLLVTTPLRKEATCHYFVSGVVEITKNGQTAILDYGNGTCDNEATLTLPNGQVQVIQLSHHP